MWDVVNHNSELEHAKINEQWYLYDHLPQPSALKLVLCDNSLRNNFWCHLTPYCFGARGDHCIVLKLSYEQNLCVAIATVRDCQQ